MELDQKVVADTLATLESSLKEPPRPFKTSIALVLSFCSCCLLVQAKVEKLVEEGKEKWKKDRAATKIESVFRGIMTRRLYNKISKENINRLSARNEGFREILKTERIYVKNLQTVIQVEIFCIHSTLPALPVSSPRSLVKKRLFWSSYTW